MPQHSHGLPPHQPSPSWPPRPVCVFVSQCRRPSLWKESYLEVRSHGARNRTDGLAQPPLIFSKSARLRVSS
jgi:hypothetical protein